MFSKIASKFTESRCETKKMESGNSVMEKLIPIVNQLQNVCKQTGTTAFFDLPQIAVVGSQSAGKSWVLENFVGRDFLPRGSGIVTRRPLILQLFNSEEEYGELCEGEIGEWNKYNDFDDIRDAIIAETDRVTGSKNGISKDPILLRIYSPNVLNLTLVDLPGITKNPVGDQPLNIEEQVRDIILEFIHKPNCLILAVTPANFDLANSDALQLAKKVDPDGLRTIGVLTKLDLMDKGTDARDIFDGKLLKLRRGYIGVVNRSQKDIDDNKDIKATLESEREFFIGHSRYKDIADRLGTPHLQKVLSEQLKQHILQTLTGLQEKTRNKLSSLKKQITDYEELHPEDSSTVIAVLIKLIQILQKNFKNEMGSLDSNDVSTVRLSCGAEIRRIFEQCLPKEISQIQYDEDEVRQDILKISANLLGFNGIINIPFKAFETLVKKQVQDLNDPVEKCIGLVVKELKNAVRTCVESMSSYPKFRNHIENEIMDFIRNNVETQVKKVLSQVEMQKARMNTQHFEFKANKIDASALLKASLPNKFTNDQKNVLVAELLNSIENKAETAAKEDPAIIRGFLFLEDELANTEYYFILTSESLVCGLRNPDRLQFSVVLKGLKFRLMKEVGDSNSNKQKIVIFKPNGGNVYENGNKVYKELVLSSHKLEDIRLWRQHLSTVIESDDRLVSFEKQVDDGYEKITSYMKAVKETLCDTVPKAAMFFVTRELEQFIEETLLVKLMKLVLTENDEAMKWFGSDADQANKYKEWKKMYETCEKALEIMENSHLGLKRCTKKVKR